MNALKFVRPRKKVEASRAQEWSPESGKGHVNVIPAGSKPTTAKNSDWEPLPKY